MPILLIAKDGFTFNVLIQAVNNQGRIGPNKKKNRPLQLNI